MEREAASVRIIQVNKGNNMIAINKNYLEAIYQELLKEREGVELCSVEDERLDAKLCLMEEILSSADWLESLN
jgi:hypothetical protein